EVAQTLGDVMDPHDMVVDIAKADPVPGLDRLVGVSCQAIEHLALGAEDLLQADGRTLQAEDRFKGLGGAGPRSPGSGSCPPGRRGVRWFRAIGPRPAPEIGRGDDLRRAGAGRGGRARSTCGPGRGTTGVRYDR